MLRINPVSECSEFWLWGTETEGLESIYKVGSCNPFLEEWGRCGRRTALKEKDSQGFGR